MGPERIGTDESTASRVPGARQQRLRAAVGERSTSRAGANGRAAGDNDSLSGSSLDTLVHLTHQLASTTDYQGLLDAILRAVVELDIAERGILFLDVDGRIEAARTHHAEGGSFEEDDVRVSESLVRKCLTEQRPAMLDKAKGLTTPSAESLRLLSAVCLPLREHGVVTGGLYLDSQRHELEDQAKVKLLEAYASLASVCLAYQRHISDGYEEISGLRKRNEQLHAEVVGGWKLENLVGDSPVWQRLMARVRTLKDVDDTVLILGETGTGKEEVARALHYEGRRRDTGPFLAINCAAVPEGLLEAELFGTVEGSFTGARSRLGLVEEADGGTLFLDEIADLQQNLQSKILRFLENRRFARLGAPTDSRQVDVRVIAATNRDLTEMMDRGEFRKDLYYRLNGAVIRMPALRENVEDLRLRLDHFLAFERKKWAPKPIELTPDARRLLLSYDWPGNVRELKFKLASICAAVSDGQAITEELVAEELGCGEIRGPGGVETIKEARARAERECLTRALRRHEWDIRAASEELGMSRQNVYNLIKSYGLTRPGTIPSRRGRAE